MATVSTQFVSTPQPLPQVANANLVAPNQNDNPQSGSPTQPAGARSLVTNTSISASNDNLAHVCDITGPMRYSIAWLSLQVKQLVEAIRNAIQGAFASASGSPFADEVRTAIKSVQSKVKQIQKLISKAQEVQSTIQKYIQDLQQLIAFILSLPARIAKFLQECLNAAYASLKDAVTNAKSIVTDSDNASLVTASSDLNSVSNSSSSSPSTQMSKP